MLRTDLNFENIKYLPVTEKDLILALDRLTRFKHPEIKYYRVFSELLSKYILEPKLTKNCIKDLDVEVLKKLIEKIWNESVKLLAPDVKSDKAFNRALIDEIHCVYKLSDSMKSFVDLDININGVLSLVQKNVTTPINLKRLLLTEKDYSDLKKSREKFNLCFPVEKVLVCEGITEEILMPKFAAMAGFNFDKNGVKLISAGGKNQVAKLYCELKDELKIPIFILLDADAKETALQIDSVKRACDTIYLIEAGEFEDIFSLNLIKRTINKRFKNICECCVADFKGNLPMTKKLADFYRINNLGDYQKADFAKQIHENLSYDTDLTDEILLIINKIKAP